ncbi:ABC transporter permease [Thermodesulfovibrio yellowstonii]|jgi:tungstate transport system permease protein|uniref:Permease component of tungstate ABC transporter n=1 Tax=Thermodesulfovibrio yellowstonii (strain ATCC 51303 / DSM 11347 / YP87) TaxID=289376 RepID=B5YGX2_THEYD|nr:ABC transporter permease [Thermodesulfovibrio yellowstonii]ACI21897.1 permease component of tungstate ABC transporter [Thermodesulfovibrio yellowstonii DSM 11347]
MNFILESFNQATNLILNLDRELLQIIFLSLKVSGIALFTATVIGLPLGAFVGLKRFVGRGLLITTLNTFMGLPPVVVGLFLYLMLSRSGPLGFLSLLYTPTAMIIAQTILAFPIVAGLTHSAVVRVAPIIKLASRSLGATSFQTTLTVIKEARYGIMSAVIAALGRVMAEVGAILIVGGNIAGYTRVMTTTIAMETDKGNFELAMALGIVLLLISLMINFFMFLIQKRGVKEDFQWD